MSEDRVAQARRPQFDPVLEPGEVGRIIGFGERQRYRSEQVLVAPGRAGLGLVVVLAGAVAVSQRDSEGRAHPIVVHRPGTFIGELAQLSGQPALFEAWAQGDVEALVIPPDQLRALLVAEAEIGERIMRALILRRVNLIETGLSGLVILGPCSEADVIRLEGFLAHNGYPHHRLDPDEDEGARSLLHRFEVEHWELPIVRLPDGRVLRNPGEKGLARALGIVEPIDPSKTFDVVVVGAGPAGLATAVYAASEGLSVVVLERRAFGGQAGASARIENYLGFPTGISGMALMARAYTQAQKFSAELTIPEEATALRRAGHGEAEWEIAVPGGDVVRTRSVVIASGARYRRLDLPSLSAFEGTSVHYWASPLAARLSQGHECRRGQFRRAGCGLRGRACRKGLGGHPWPVARGQHVALPRRAHRGPTECRGSLGRGSHVARRTGRYPGSGRMAQPDLRPADAQSDLPALPVHRRRAGHAVAHDVERGARRQGLVLTGDDLGEGRLPMETNQRGVFAIGDVRSGSTKRVASGLGEGAQVVATLHAYLSGLGGQPATHPGRAGQPAAR